MAEVTVPGVSTLEAKLGYAADGDTIPESGTVTLLGRINSIGGISLATEQIDASALEDKVSKYVAGRQDPGGEWTITINATDATLDQWDGIKGTKKWFEIIVPGITKAFWARAQVPQVLPSGELGQNELFTIELTLTLVDIGGWATKISPSGV